MEANNIYGQCTIAGGVRQARRWIPSQRKMGYSNTRPQRLIGNLYDTAMPRLDVWPDIILHVLSELSNDKKLDTSMLNWCH